MTSSDKAHIWHPFTQMRDWCAPDHEPIVLAEGEGAVLRDIEGREYIDGNSSIWTNIHGHRHPRISAAIAAQLGKVAHVSFLGTTHEPAIRLAERLLALTGGGRLRRVFYSDNGSTAVEVAIKMSLQYWQLVGEPGRTRFVSFAGAYHGDTSGAASLGGVGIFVDRFAAVHFPVTRVSGVGELEGIDASGIAAIIVEPLVQGTAGIRVWPSGMLRALRAWCNKTGVHLIFDEVLTGFGRTGRMFACQHEEVWPDFLCLAKGFTGGYLPLAATVTTEEIFSAFLGRYEDLKTFFYGHSFCANPLGCAAALASLEVFAEERTLENLQPKIGLLRELLDGLASHPRVKEVRQCGFIAGVELQGAPGQPLDWRKQTGARVCWLASRHGLLTRPILDTVAIIPPLCISETQMHKMVEALRVSIGEF